MTLKNCWEIYCGKQASEVCKNTLSHYKTAYKKFAGIENKPVSEITPKDIQPLIDEEDRFYPARYIKNLATILLGIACENGEVEYNIGKLLVLSTENKGKPYGKNKIVVCVDTRGNFVGEFSSLNKAMNALGLASTSHISACCKGEYDSYNGYRFAYGTKEEYRAGKLVFGKKKEDIAS